MVKLLFYHFRVTNSRLKNKRHYFELLVQRIKKNLEFEVARNFFTEMTYNSELFQKNVDVLNLVELDIDLALNRYCLRS